VSELAFVGAGLGDERDLTERGRAALSTCDRIFAEEYTSLLAPGSLDRLSRKLGKPIVRLDRQQVENGAPILEALSAHARVGLLVTGDPFVATTHVALRIVVEDAGHRWRYIPNASVGTAAAGLLGLQSYRFGRTVSVPFPEPGFAPTSPLDGIVANGTLRLHTLVLLDLRPAERRFLTATEAIRALVDRDPSGRAFAPGRPVAVVARLGTEEARAWYGPWELLEGTDFGPPLHALVVPSEPLHFEEEAAVRRWKLSPGSVG
jgi:diphthine synthase